MKKLFFLLVVFSLSLAVAQNQAPDPGSVWKEYMDQKPETSEFVDLLRGASFVEPYRPWCLEELSQRNDQTNPELVFLVLMAPEPYARMFWEKLQIKGTIVDFLAVLTAEDTPGTPIRDPNEEYRVKAFELVSSRFTAQELAPRLGIVNNEYGEKLVDVFLQKNPSERNIATAFHKMVASHTNQDFPAKLKMAAEILRRAEESQVSDPYLDALLVHIIKDSPYGQAVYLDIMGKAFDVLLSHHPSATVIRSLRGYVVPGKTVALEEELVQKSGKKERLRLIMNGWIHPENQSPSDDSQ